MFGDLDRAIQYRRNEISLIRRLHAIIRDPVVWEAVVAPRYGYADLADRLDLLAVLVDKKGSTPEAVRLLNVSKKLCEAHGLPFDGQDILDELTAEESALGVLKEQVAMRRRPR